MKLQKNIKQFGSYVTNDGMANSGGRLKLMLLAWTFLFLQFGALPPAAAAQTVVSSTPQQSPLQLGAPIEQLLGVLPVAAPCHLLYPRVSYAYPAYTMVGQWPTYLPGNTIGGIRMDVGLPAGTYSIEQQSYPNGKFVLVPYVNANASSGGTNADAWLVYSVAKVEKVLRNYAYNTVNGIDVSRDVVPVDSMERILETNSDFVTLYRKARPREDFLWGTASLQTLGWQTPFVSNKNWDPGMYNDGPNIGHGFYYDEYVYEQCTPVSVFTPASFTNIVVPSLAAQGYTSCTGNYAAYQFGLSEQAPDCLGTYLLSASRDNQVWQNTSAAAGFVPFVGTAFKINDCLNSGDPACWGETAVSAVTDLASIIIPVKAVSSASGVTTYTRVQAVKQFANGATKPILGMAAAGQAGMALKDLSDGNKLSALGRFVGAGAFAYELSFLRTSSNKRVSSVRNMGAVPDETPSCSMADPAPQPPANCKAGIAKLTATPADGCTECLLVNSFSDIPVALNLPQNVATDLISGQSDLAAIAAQIPTNPAAAIDSLGHLGVPSSAQLTADTVYSRTWRNGVTITQKQGPYDIVILESDVANWVAEAVADGAPLADEISTSLINSIRRQSFYYRDATKTAVTFRVLMKDANGNVRSVGTGSVVAGENVIAKVIAQGNLEESIHALQIGVPGGVGLRQKPSTPTMTANFVPLSPRTYKFKCWIESLSDAELVNYFSPSATDLALAAGFRQNVLNTLVEGDIAFWFRDQGVPLTRGSMQNAGAIAQYGSRVLIDAFMQAIEGISYYSP